MELQKLSDFQKLMLINAHPFKLIMNAIGGVIALFYLWQHMLLLAILLGGSFIAAGTLIATKLFKIHPQKIAGTFFGEIFLTYSTVTGFICYMASHILIPLSFWLHNLLLSATGLILLAGGLIKMKEPTAKNNS